MTQYSLQGLAKKVFLLQAEQGLYPFEPVNALGCLVQ